MLPRGEQGVPFMVSNGSKGWTSTSWSPSASQPELRSRRVANTLSARTIKVLDFGIAKAMQEGETATELVTRTSSGFSAFSPQAGAPEQFRPKRYGQTGPWTDVHGVGLCLTEIVTGKAALGGEEFADFFEAATSAQRPTPRNRGASVSDAFEAVCARALALMPKDRYQDAKELLDALDALGMLRSAVLDGR